MDTDTFAPVPPQQQLQLQQQTMDAEVPPGAEPAPVAHDREAMFIDNVRAYLAMHEEIAALARQASAMRKRKQELRDYIVHYMKSNDVEQCMAADCKLYVATTKSRQPVNKDYIFAMLSNEMGVPVAERFVDALWSNREVTTRDTLRRSKLKPS